MALVLRGYFSGSTWSGFFTILGEGMRRNKGGRDTEEERQGEGKGFLQDRRQLPALEHESWRRAKPL